MRILSAFGAALAAALVASAANAVVVPFGGNSTGTDPLGQTWEASNNFAPAWGEPGLGQGSLTFNASDFSNGAGNWANEFDFIFLEGVSGSIDTTPASGPGGFETTTRFDDEATNMLWTPVFVSNKEVHFIAPAGTRLNPGDQFFVNVVFTGPVNTDKFSFAGLWTDRAGVPEPAAWAMLILGLGMIGFAARRRRDGLALAA